MLAIVWFGLRLTKTTLRELIGGAWDGISLLIDVGLAAGFWFVSALVIGAVKLALGLADLKNAQVSHRRPKESRGRHMPQSGRDLVFLSAAGRDRGHSSKKFFFADICKSNWAR